MDKVELILGVTSTRQDVYLEMRVQDEARAHMFLSPAEAEECAQKIADARSGAEPEVSRELDPNPRLRAVHDPVWRTKHGNMEGIGSGMLLILRHPGLGWLPFHLPYQEAKALGQWLVDNSHPPETSDASPASES